MELRETFNEVADLYDRVRPRYPAPLLDDVAALDPLNLKRASWKAVPVRGRPPSRSLNADTT